MRLLTFFYLLFLCGGISQPVSGNEPPVQKLSIRVKTIELSAPVTLGKRYQLEVSSDLNTWTAFEPDFLAASPEYRRAVDVDAIPRFFRLKELVPEYAPVSVANLTILLARPTGEQKLKFSAANYELIQDVMTLESGAFTESRSGNTITVGLLPVNSPSGYQTLQLTFSSTNSGSYVHSTLEGQTETGQFSIESPPVFPPATFDGRTARFQLTSGFFAGSDFVQAFSATTFAVISGSSGAGNYTYSLNGNTATLFQTYTSPASAAAEGDYDNYILTFSSATTADITGTQRTGGMEKPVTGVFTLLP